MIGTRKSVQYGVSKYSIPVSSRCIFVSPVIEKGKLDAFVLILVAVIAPVIILDGLICLPEKSTSSAVISDGIYALTLVSHIGT